MKVSDKELQEWRDFREQWLTEHRFAGLDDLFREKWLALELPDYELVNATILGPTKREPTEEQAEEIERVGGELRWDNEHHTTVVAVKVPFEMADTVFARWARRKR